jgi:tRNA dimethylallyltransferase
MDEKKLPKLIVLLGPTAAGKTEWGIRLAKKFHGEVISADSRQIYKKMSIGTAKQPGEWQWQGLHKVYMVDDIPHHLVDFLDPGKTFTVAQFRDRAVKHIKLAYRNGTVPFIVGGTGLYLSAIVDNYHIPRTSPNKKLRSSLEGKSKEELLQLLQSLDPETAAIIDVHNIRRVIRALEVCILTGQPFSEQREKGEQLFNVLQIGVQADRQVLYERIHKRVEAMMKAGLLKEVESLMKQKYAWHLPSMSGVGYRQFKMYFDGVHTLPEVVERIKRDTRHFARRQLTWFRRDTRTKWVRTYEEAEALVAAFLDD